MKENSLFQKEEALLTRAANILAEEDEKCGPGTEAFIDLLEGSRRLLKQLKLLIKTGDKQQHRLNKLNDQLELRNRFIKQTFSRYLSDDVVREILESPEGSTLGGEKREVTVLMSDVRGFSDITETMPAESVVTILNNYFEIMTEVIIQYGGTINEFIGDGILAVFGAPIKQEEHAQNAVACAVAMQLAMEKVNLKNTANNHPQLHMGIGINTGEMVVGNIGSSKRVKYGVVGSHVNLTSRIESYTGGGQILISKSTKEICDAILDIRESMEVMPKGAGTAITIYDVGGIRGPYQLQLPPPRETVFKQLPKPLELRFSLITDKNVDSRFYRGTLVSIGDYFGDIISSRSVRRYSNMQITLMDETNLKTLTLQGKVMENFSEPLNGFRVHFTYMPPGADEFFKNYLQTMEDEGW